MSPTVLTLLGTMPTALLLPLGLWLVLSAATPKNDETRIAAAGLLAVLVSTLMFVAVGFAFMFGGMGRISTAFQELSLSLGLSIGPQRWGLMGYGVFFLTGVTHETLKLIVPYLALTQACAVLANSVLARRNRFAAQMVFVGGISLIFSVVGHWVFARGWLAALGANMQLGHGAVDLGGLSTVGLVAGLGGTILAHFLAHQNPITKNHTPATPAPNIAPTLPVTHFPLRAVAGALCFLIGCVVVVSNNPLLNGDTERTALGYLVNLLVGCSVAGLISASYGTITSPTRQIDLLGAARGMVAAAVALSSGAGLLPLWLAVVLGIVAGLITTLGMFVAREKFGLSDDGALATTVLLPAVIGFLATGLFANGTLGAGLNGVGANEYLAQVKLGVVGALPLARVGDAGQLSAQVCAVIAIGLFVWVAMRGLKVLLQPMLAEQPMLEGAIESTAIAAPSAALSLQLAMSFEKPVPELAPGLPAPALADVLPIAPATLHPVAADVPDAGEATAAVELEAVETALPAVAAPKPAVVPAADSGRVWVKVHESTSPAPETLLERLRRIRRAAPRPEQPARARKIAYPTRVNGKPLARPLADEPGK